MSLRVRDTVDTSGNHNPDTLSRSDLRLVERAVRRGWDIPEAVFRALPAKLIQIINDSSSNTREKLGAIRAMIQMHGQNQTDDPATQRVEHAHLHIHTEAGAGERRDRMAAIAAGLGVEPLAPPVLEAAADGVASSADARLSEPDAVCP